MTGIPCTYTDEEVLAFVAGDLAESEELAMAVHIGECGGCRDQAAQFTALHRTLGTCTDDDIAVVKVYPDRLAEPEDFVEKDNKELGEIIVRPTVKCSFDYINKPEEAQAKYYKGWLYIGDLGTWDENEYVTVAGRKDDMIISGGENIQPVQVEEIINAHQKVSENVVVGMPSEQYGEVVVAYVVPQDSSVTARELDEYCLSHPMLARFKRPRFYRFVEKLPMTATGKKMHYKIRAQAVEDFRAGVLEEI